MKVIWYDSIHGRSEMDATEVHVQGLDGETFSGFSINGEATLTPWPLSIRMVVETCGIEFDRLRSIPESNQESLPGSLTLPEVIGSWHEGGEEVVAHQQGLLFDDVYIESVAHMENGSTVVKMAAAYPQPS